MLCNYLGNYFSPITHYKKDFGFCTLHIALSPGGAQFPPPRMGRGRGRGCLEQGKTCYD